MFQSDVGCQHAQKIVKCRVHIVWHRYRNTTFIVVLKIVKAVPMVASKGTLFLVHMMVDDGTFDLLLLCGFSYVMGCFFNDRVTHLTHKE